jgi:hypothetical protein
MVKYTISIGYLPARKLQHCKVESRISRMKSSPAAACSLADERCPKMPKGKLASGDQQELIGTQLSGGCGAAAAGTPQRRTRLHPRTRERAR